MVDIVWAGAKLDPRQAALAERSMRLPHGSAAQPSKLVVDTHRQCSFCKREQDRTFSLYIARCERSLEEAQSQAALGGNFAKAKM